MTPNPYDELPYRSVPIEWTAPERLALTSLLHGGPRVPLNSYRVLELGCGDGTNLLPLAYYRRNATFIGIDAASSAIARAEAHRSELALENVEFICADFLSAAGRLSGSFDFILAHGVLSWVSDSVRDVLLTLCATQLRARGLLYLNYNAKPGWNIRGMVRDFLRAQTAESNGLRSRAALAQEIARKLATAFAASTEHPYARLMEGEFRLVCDGSPSYVAHEYLAEDNRAYWRSEFLTLAHRQGLEYVADADFNYPSGRTPINLKAQIAAAQLLGQPLDDTMDLVCFRQLHSPILTSGGWTQQPPSGAEFAEMFVASCLVPDGRVGHTPRVFRHPSGHEVESRTDAMSAALERLQAQWPRGVQIRTAFRDVDSIVEDLVLLYRHGMIELTLVDDPPLSRGPLNEAERRWRGEVTTPRHTREAVTE